METAHITTIKEIHKHSNADRLQCVTVFGNNVIVDLSYTLGQRVVFLPTDLQLSEEFANDNNLLRKKDDAGNNIGGYMDPDKRNIVALKLRGEKSEGLILPIEVLSKYTDISKLSDGDTFSELNGHKICCKYIPCQKSEVARNYTSKSGKPSKDKAKIVYPYFIEHIDTQQLMYNEAAFKPGDTVYLTLKMHGTSARTANTVKVETHRCNWLQRLLKQPPKQVKSYSCITGTRRTTLKASENATDTNLTEGYYSDNTFRLKYHNLFKSRLPKGMEVFYEIVGWVNNDTTIMGKANNKLIKDKEFIKQYGDTTTFSYGCNLGENACYVYRMTMTNEDGIRVEIPWEQVQIECEKMGVEHVPLFEKFIFTTWDDLMARVNKYVDGPDPVGISHVREGVVVRIDNRESFTAFKIKNFSFKVLEGICKDTADAPDMEEAEELIQEEL